MTDSGDGLWQAAATANEPLGQMHQVRDPHLVCLGDSDCLLGGNPRLLEGVPVDPTV